MTRRTLEIAALCTALLVAALAVHAWLAARDDQQRLAATLAAQKQIIDSADANERARNVSLSAALAQIEKLKRDVQTPAEILRELPKYLQLPRPITLASGPGSARAQSEQGTAAPASRSAGVSPADSSSINPWRDAAHPSALGGAIDGDCGGAPLLSRARPCSGAQTAMEGQGFNSDGGIRSKADTSLPRAVVEALTPQQQSAPPAVSCNPSSAGCSAQIPADDLKPLFNYVQNCRACQAELAAARQNSADDAAKIGALTRQRDAAVTGAKGGSFIRRLRRNAVWFALGAAGGYLASKR